MTNRNLKEMCDSILLLLATSVEAMEPVLWPHLMDYLLAPDFGPAIPSIVKSLGRGKAHIFLVIVESNRKFQLHLHFYLTMDMIT